MHKADAASSKSACSKSGCSCCAFQAALQLVLLLVFLLHASRVTATITYLQEKCELLEGHVGDVAAQLHAAQARYTLLERQLAAGGPATSQPCTSPGQSSHAFSDPRLDHSHHVRCQRRWTLCPCSSASTKSYP
jgi:hypothetical protein